MRIVPLATLFYYGISYFLLHCSIIPSSVTKKKEGLWYNTFVSLVNSLILSGATLYCFYVEPLRIVDLAATETNVFARQIPLFCIGYFVYDAIHSAVYLTSDKTKPICLHHALVLVCYLVGMLVDYYNYITVSLLYEINTVFLHIRQLCNVAGVSRDNFFYRLNRVLNFVTFILFRICNFSWIIFYTLFLLDTNVAFMPYLVGVLAMLILLFGNVYLLVIVVRSDSRSHSKQNVIPNGTSNPIETYSTINGTAVHSNGSVTQ